MANHKSALKRAKQNPVKNMRNKSIKTKIKNAVKAVREATLVDSANAFVAAQSAIDKAVKKGVLHKKTGARKISRLSVLANKANAA